MARTPAMRQKTEATTEMANDQSTVLFMWIPKMAKPITIKMTDKKQNMTRAIIVEFFETVCTQRYIMGG